MTISDNVSERAQARLGTVLRSKWTLDSILGIGGMAVVYAATHRNQNRVAIKILHPEVSVDKDVTQRFLREGYAANTVGHPGTVRVLDDDMTEDGAAFLVMELLEGETVEARWARKGERLPVLESLSILDQLLLVLESAHAKGIVHRDLKPENLFLTRDGQLKVLDFGIARLRELTGGQGTTRAGSLLGTPAFMAPEQARGRWEDVDHRTDLWAAGATLYTLLTGAFVHEAGTVHEQLIAAATKPATPFAEVYPGIDGGVAALIDRALAFDKEQRWPSAEAMRAALRDAAEDGTFGPPPSLPRPSLAMSVPTVSVADGAAVSLTEPLTTSRPLTGDVVAPRSRQASGRRRWLVGGAVLALGTAGFALLARTVEPEARPEPSASAALVAPPRASLAPPPLAQVAPAPTAETPAAPPPSASAAATKERQPTQRPAGGAGTKPATPLIKTVHAPVTPPVPVPPSPSPKPEGNPYDRRH